MFKKKKYKLISLLVLITILLIPIINSSIKEFNNHKEEKLLVQKITNKEDFECSQLKEIKKKKVWDKRYAN